MKKQLLKRFAVTASYMILALNANSQAFTENFDDITTLSGSGWATTNASVSVGSTSWFQGNPTSAGGPFDSYNGAANAYIGANYNNTGSTGTISNWLMTPNRTFRNGDVITFYTRKASPDTYADRLEVRLSTNGTSTSVGSGTTVGDYTTLLLSVNPNLTLGVYPTTWTQYTITISGLSAPTSGRVAFRYYVTGGGLSGTNSDYIGIDNVVYTPYVCPAFTLTTGGALTGGTAGNSYTQALSQTGALGTPNFAVTAGALPPGLTLSTSGTISGTPTATGTFNFSVTVSDNSGCSGSESYSIDVICPSNPITFSGIPALCENDTAHTLTEASPAGGTYSGTGVNSGTFDPSFGNQTITYEYTDPYGCYFTNSTIITVNTPPTVTAGNDVSICIGDSVTLSGSGAATYSWNNSINDGVPFAGTATQTYTVTGTDGNGCSNIDSLTVTVNPLPTVFAGIDDTICSGEAITLAGSGAQTYSWTNNVVNGVVFTPADTAIYVVTGTDSNGCINSDSITITVKPLPVVSLSALADLCTYSSPIALTEGSPTGGTYSGTGVNAGTFDPQVAGAGTFTISYTLTENGCQGTAQQTIIVDECLGISENELVGLSIYPNPANEQINISFENTFTSNIQLTLSSSDGKLIYSKTIESPGLFTDTVSVQELSDGIYYISLKSYTGNSTYKLIISK